MLGHLYLALQNVGSFVLSATECWVILYLVLQIVG